ncbi:MAG: hypothetical protein HFH45_03010 [Bacilli bacterium]|nr:hypothetical protein [Bacilli bacterium]
MYGAIIGDLAGSIYEYDEMLDSRLGIRNIGRRKEILTKENIIDADSFYSDDTILTMAILESILEDTSYFESLKKYGLEYKDFIPTDKPYFKNMFSPNFIKWCMGLKDGDSYGNGAAMRISPIGYLFDDEEMIRQQVRLATTPSHNTFEAIIGAEEVAMVIYMARLGYSINEIKVFVQANYGHSLYLELYKLIHQNSFNCSCEYSVKLAIFALFASNSFEEVIRNAVSFGGDTDTIACIAGSMAEAIYGVPTDLKEAAVRKLPDNFNDLLDKGYSKVKTLKK